MAALLGLLLAASIDGEAALRHASALAALGPHPWGSPRNQAAAAYVAAQLREAGLDEVELQAFERHGIRGTNVVATLPGARRRVRGDRRPPRHRPRGARRLRRRRREWGS